MPQICPSPSRQLAAASLAFRHARRRFPKDLGVCACSGDTKRPSMQVYPAITKTRIPVVNNISLDPIPKTDRPFSSNSQRKGNYTSYQSLSSSRTASWTNDCCGDPRGGQTVEDLNGITRAQIMCATCGKRNSSCKVNNDKEYQVPNNQGHGMRVDDDLDGSKILPARSRRLYSRIETTEFKESNRSCIETASKLTHNSATLKKMRHARHRHTCIHAGKTWRAGSQTPPKPQGSSQICLLHGYSLPTKRRSSIPRKSQTEKCKITQNWEHRTHRESHTRDDFNSMSRRGEIHCHQCPNYQQNQFLNLSRNVETTDKLYAQQNENSLKNDLCLIEKPEQLISHDDVCLRPSLIKAAQRKMDLGIQEPGKNYQHSKICGQLSKKLDVKSSWDENLNVINHKDSMSILMERFRGNDKHQNLRKQNIHELNPVMRNRINCGEEELLQSEKIHQRTNSTTNGSLSRNFDDAESIDTNLLPRKSSSGVNPVTKLGRVANQALKENENHFKNLRSRINRSGMCCSSKGTSWRRAF